MIIALLSVNDLTVAYGEHTIIDDLSFEVNKGDFLIIAGENGVGKTTLINTILGKLTPRSGNIDLANNTRMGYVPQFRNLDVDYPLSVRNFVALNLTRSWRPWLSKKEQRMVDRVLRETNLAPIQDRPMGLASGGEKQRAYLAQALVNDPQLLILDESTASLDNEMKYELLDLVARLQETGLTVMFITHDEELARHYGSRYLLMKQDGYESGPINELPSWKGGVADA